MCNVIAVKHTFMLPEHLSSSAALGLPKQNLTFCLFCSGEIDAGIRRRLSVTPSDVSLWLVLVLQEVCYCCAIPPVCKKKKKKGIFTPRISHHSQRAAEAKQPERNTRARANILNGSQGVKGFIIRDHVPQTTYMTCH